MGTVIRDQGKVYIEGVRQVTWDTGEMCEFASCLVSALESMNEPIHYPFVMGVSGVAFRFTLHPGQWDFTNYSIRNMAPQAFDPIRRAFLAAGYQVDQRDAGSRQKDTARITASIDHGVPVLAFPVVGPSDCSIITGYDQGGEVLLGWSTFQNIPDDHDIPPDETGYFRKPGWHENTRGYLLIGAKIEPPALRSVYLETLRWAVHLLRMPGFGTWVTGLAGMRLWAEEMVDEKYFPLDQSEVIGQRYVSTAINMTMLRDHCDAAAFLSQVAIEFPEWNPEISQAVDRYHEVIHLRTEMDALISDNFSGQAMEAFRDPEIRRAYADRILQICDQELQAICSFEKLLERC